MATPGTVFHLSGLAARLVREGLIDEAQAEEIHGRAAQKRRSFFAQLMRHGKIDTAHAARVASDEFGIPLLDVSAIDLTDAPIDVIDRKLMERHHVLPLYKRGSKLFVALADPTNTRALDDVKFHTGLGAEPILVDGAQLETAIEHALDQSDTTLTDLAGDERLEDIDVSTDDDSGGQEVAADQIDAPIVRFVNKVILDAIKKNSSDIHVEPYEKSTRIRYRVDGVLHEVASPPTSLLGRIAARIKIMARLDIAERRVPQDGRMKMHLSRNRSIDFRVNTLPTLYGEKVVIRILDSSIASLGVEHLGFEPEQRQTYEEAINRPYGMILVTGPTGSGKTVSLYTALGMLNTPERNISSVEDPVEINLTGVNQVNINERANLTFATALRAFLRQDPDIIMVGEVRDLETADIAIKASQTGHLVLSTLHTNDCPSTLTRLLNMGVAPFNVASSVHLIMAQRLTRRLCDSCKVETEIPEPALLEAGFDESEAEGLKIYAPVGCSGCTDGYKGRVGIFEVMPISVEMGSLIMRGCTEHEIAELAKKEGVNGLRRSGLNKVKAGVTSLEEIERVTNQ